MKLSMGTPSDSSLERIAKSLERIAKCLEDNNR